MSGTARNAPTIPHILDQKISESNITNQLRLRRFPIILGSKIFPEINCGINKHTKRITDIRPVSNTVKLYKKGSIIAIMPQIAGIKSNKKTSKANISAYSRPKKYIIIPLIPAFKSARENFERKNKFISWYIFLYI
jgi:hypothetical protein